ncbi:MAG: hypothetical protein IPG74_09005 [Flavobacteriales bacterium]|nr:hypothetical protein [Flavobacteriales bacterium]
MTEGALQPQPRGNRCGKLACIAAPSRIAAHDSGPSGTAQGTAHFQVTLIHPSAGEDNIRCEVGREGQQSRIIEPFAFVHMHAVGTLELKWSLFVQRPSHNVDFEVEVLHEPLLQHKQGNTGSEFGVEEEGAHERLVKSIFNNQ